MAIDKLVNLGTKFKTEFIVSISLEEKDLPENAKPYVVVAL